ncbi:MAG: hypothetical protein H7101_10330 [Deinococcales bacterium]|nr:hypothetical protein [Chitinophagaceae bacterium]
MDSTTIIFGVTISVIIAGLAGWLIYLQRKATVEESNKADSSKVLQLQAYERLILVVSRIALPNVISRVNMPNMGVRDMQTLMIQAIREEFDYNITQQIYVTTAAWEAVKNLKEQNMLAVNQLASSLPPTATGLDLNKLILDYVMNDRKGNLHEVVAEVLSYEAKKML